MREFVRGLLALLLATGMTVVFVGCEADDDEGAGGAHAAGGDHDHDHGGDHHDGGADADSGADEVAEMMSTAAPEGDYTPGAAGEGCRAEGADGDFGYCSVPRNNCEDNNGTLVSNRCAGGADVVCCVNHQCGPTDRPDAGVCASESACDVGNGFAVQSGLCPGGADIKCCVADEETANQMAAEEEAANGGTDAGETAAAGGSAAAAGGADAGETTDAAAGGTDAGDTGEAAGGGTPAGGAAQ